MTLDTFQLGEPVEHRDCHPAPLFPVAIRSRPTSRSTRRCRAGSASRRPRTRAPCPSSSSRTRPTARCCSTTARSSSARSRTGSSTSASSSARVRSYRSPSRASSRDAGAAERRIRLARHISHSHLRRRRPRCWPRSRSRSVSRRATSGMRVRQAGADGSPLPDSGEPRHVRGACSPAPGTRVPAFALTPGQWHTVLGIGDDLCLDAVSRPDAFALLWPKLRAGYLLDALRASRWSRDVRRADLLLPSLSAKRRRSAAIRQGLARTCAFAEQE